MTVSQVADVRPSSDIQPQHLPVGFGHHVVYAGAKYDQMVEWYATLLNGEVTRAQGAPSAGLLARDGVDNIVIVERSDLDQEEGAFRTGVFHIAWSYASLAEIMTVYRHARDNGIMPHSVLNTGILLQFYYVDPEGNFLEFELDAHDTSEATQEAQRSGKRDTQPALWSYDPEKIIALMEAGWPDADIMNHTTFHAAAVEPAA